MKKILLIFAISLGTLVHAQAQSGRPVCGSHHILQQIESQNPGYIQHLNEIGNNYGLQKTRGNIIYIPVVVHIVYKNATENLSDAYVTAQIDLLNKSYARLNSDTNNLRAVFKPYVGPTDIRFVLAQIKRVPTSVQGFDFISDFSGNILADDVKISANGGSDAVNPTKNLNIWVCDIIMSSSPGELLGYAYPPAGLPNWSTGSSYPSVTKDGVVIDYMAFGGSTKLPLGSSSMGLKGKTTVHEVGHYLGLRHIWGDDFGACQGDFGFEDDGITDTPHAADESQFDCDKTKNTCNQGANDLPDMVENYMDYSAETCQNSFTKGQASFMYNVLSNVRTGIRVPTAVNETTIDNGISIYPNPAQQTLNIYVAKAANEKTTIEIRTITGQLVRTYVHELQTPLITLQQLNQLIDGVYIATIQVGDYRINKSFIIQQ